MKVTARQTSTRTLADMFRAMDRQHPVTLWFLKEEKDEAGKKTGKLVETVRTIEIFDIWATEDGEIIVEGMQRRDGTSRRVRVDRILGYARHRTAYLVERPADARTAPVFRTPAQLVAYEVGRDERKGLKGRYAKAA